MIVNPPSSRLRARTVAIDDPGRLEDYLTRDQSMAFVRRGDGVVGIGEICRFTSDSLDAADIQWTEFAKDIENETELYDTFGAGPIAFGSFSFDPDHSAEPSVLIVPEVVIGRRGDVSWCTRLGWDRVPEGVPSRQAPPVGPSSVSWADGSMSPVVWESVVGEVIEMIRAGQAAKVVLARDLVASAPEPLDARWVVRRLADAYPSTWTYLVDGLLGATPEMLIRRQGGLITSRVLAGTIRRGGADDPSRLAAALSSSSKDMVEHEFAVASVAEALTAFCSGMNVPDAPYVLELPNVLHLATDITGVALPDASALALAAALHPSAAVCGTPTHVARDLISEFENLDRGRYAGPIGWIDTHGDGEWALALRGGQIHKASPNEIQMFAGCGIVADSVPAEEVAETVAKFVPMRDALGC